MTCFLDSKIIISIYTLTIDSLFLVMKQFIHNREIVRFGLNSARFTNGFEVRIHHYYLKRISLSVKLISDLDIIVIYEYSLY